MALKHWHPGKLVLFWVLCFLGGFGLIALGQLFWPDSPVTIGNDPMATIMFTGLGYGFCIVPFVVTWKWFTAREKRN